jgi:hypothetical protein
MSVVITPKITFNGKEATDGILEPAFGHPEFKSIMDVRQDIKAKEQIAFLGRISKVTKKDGGAGTGKQNRVLKMSQKYWDPQKMKIWVSLSEDEIEDTYFVWLTKTGVDRRNIEDHSQYYQQWVLEVFTEAAREDAMRIAWLGDTAVAKQSAGGTLSNDAEVSVDDYNQLDGLFKQIFAGVTAGTIKYVEIAENDEATQAGQLALDDNGAYLIYRAMINKADPRLKKQKDQIILVTETLNTNRLDEKESKFPNVFEMIKRQDEQFNDDVYRSVPIISMQTTWDLNIQADFISDTGVIDRPHRAVYTTVSNLVAGFDAIGGIDDFRTYFDEETETVNFKGLYKFDVKLLQEFLVVAAY